MNQYFGDIKEQDAEQQQRHKLRKTFHYKRQPTLTMAEHRHGEAIAADKDKDLNPVMSEVRKQNIKPVAGSVREGIKKKSDTIRIKGKLVLASGKRF